MRAIETWRLRTYEVWGGGPDDEGAEWNVNNVFDEGTVEIPEDPTDDEIIAAIAPMYKEAVRPRIEVDGNGSDDMTVYLQLDNGYPLCEVTRR